jgi:hypothetical protein
MIHRSAALAAVTIAGVAALAGVTVLAIAPEARRAAVRQMRELARSARRRAMGMYEDLEDALARQHDFRAGPAGEAEAAEADVQPHAP